MPDAKTESLCELAKEIRLNEDWWIFPVQDPIKGFMGTGPIFIVGDQPSWNEWGVGHPNRETFYGHLQRVGASTAHLTDICKRRGECNELENRLPDDFEVHLKLLRREIEIVQPTRIVALGCLAQKLLIQYVPECREVPQCMNGIPRMWHFAYVVREGLIAEYESNMRAAIWG